MAELITNMDQIKGHNRIIEFLQFRIQTGTLPQFIIFSSEEGIGKTSLVNMLAKQLTCTTATEEQEFIDFVVKRRANTEYVHLFNGSKEGGKDAMREVAALMKNNFNPEKNRVIIIDECHALTEYAQDLLLEDLENLAPNTYVFMATTDTMNMRKALKSRALPIILQRLTRAELVKLLKHTAEKHNIKIQGGDVTLALIAEWAEFKPRTAINLLVGYGKDAVLDTASVLDYMGYDDVKAVLPLVTALSGSLTLGIQLASTMEIKPNMINLLIQVLKVKTNSNANLLSIQDTQYIQQVTSGVQVKSIINLIANLSSHDSIKREQLIHAFITSHVEHENLAKPPKDAEALEYRARLENSTPVAEVIPQLQEKAPTLDDLLSNAKAVKN